MRTVSHSKDRSVAGMGWKRSSTWAMVTDLTESSPSPLCSVALLALRMVWRGIDGHAHADQFVLVNLVAAALGHGLYQADDADARLQGVVPGDQADVASTDDEQPFGTSDQVAVDECLEGAGTIDTGQGIALEGKRLFTGTGRHEQHLGGDQHIPVAARRMPTFLSLNTARAVLSSQMRTESSSRTCSSSLVAMSMPRVPA